MPRQRDFSVLRRRVADNVRRLRLAARLTLVAASERADLDLRHWQKIEAGEQNLTVTMTTMVRHRLRPRRASSYWNRILALPRQPPEPARVRRHGRVQLRAQLRARRELLLPVLIERTA
jgi:hypothetical protein